MTPLNTPIGDALDVHRASCKRCTPFAVCPVAAALLEKLTELMLPSIPDMPRPKAKA